MSCEEAKPIFFQRQPVLPLPVQRFLRTRLEAALQDPANRALLVWPTVLGAPKLRQEYPDGLPEELLFAHAVKMLHLLGQGDPGPAWAGAISRFPDTAEAGGAGWKPHRDWGHFGPLVSLRSGVALSALSELVDGPSYTLKAGLVLFNSALFHETHDALEILWDEAAEGLKRGLQGLILLAAGYHHLQHHNASGMRAVWEEGLARLEPFQGLLDTPWGRVDHRESVQATEARMALLQSGIEDMAPLWELPAPRWELA